VLASVPRSRLLVLAHEGAHRSKTLEAMTRLGIDAARIAFATPCRRDAYLEVFNRIDISLDTVPYNGHTTSLDSLWMGVPVVTVAGATVVGRAGVSQLTNVGLPELIASTGDDYVSIASDLAFDLARLSDLRRTLRARMERSPVMNVKPFAAGIELAYRHAWQRWCDSQVSGSNR
jgi:predicted O-linked N-acetylglucosamine transferase (SPINDLY family)